MPDSVYSFSVKTSDGQEQSLEKYRGQVLMIVNVASRCGYTPQYDGLEKLYKTYHSQGLTILGFPCNQFGAQEPGSNKEVQEFCRTNFGVSFPVMAKIDVNGEKADPLYKYLKAKVPGILGTEAIKWNFTKFLVDKNGQVVERFAPQVEPSQMTLAVEKLL